MHISAIILEGFKSYFSRTEIGPFDPHFNAITGLNGSGKSNILDGICFVLGISSLSIVRAQNLSELIHKGSNVTRASVSLVLNNLDKSPGKSPSGYEDYDEILVSRTIEQGNVCKFYINSSLSTKKAISDLFESVCMNINTPNFMIMQGKITKVINMRPKEILNMIEETVGALTYQIKRDKSRKEILDKDKQINEIHQMLEEVINPAIQKQEKAKADYGILQNIKAQYEDNLVKESRATYHLTKKLLEETKVQCSEFRRELENEEETKRNMIQTKADYKKKHEEITKEANKLLSENLADLGKEMDSERKKCSDAEIKLDIAKKDVKSAEKKVKVAEDMHKKEEKNIQNFKKSSENQIKELESVQEEIKVANENLESSKKAKDDCNMGNIELDDGRAVNLQDELLRAQDELGKVEPLYESERVELSREKELLKEKERKLANTKKDDDIEREYLKASAEVKKLEGELVKRKIDPAEAPMLGDNIHKANKELGDIKQRTNRTFQNYPALNFTYSDPAPNFDRSKVYGLIYNLFEITDQKWAGAFEVAASGYFNQVVVDTDETGKLLLKNGRLQRRTTIHVLSKIQNVDRRYLSTQKKLDETFGPGKAIPALSIIKYDRAYTALFETFFGKVVFTDSIETGKVCAFNLNFKAVTIDGDVLNPDGIMQGGTRTNLGHYLNTCQELRSLNSRKIELENNLRSWNERLHICKNNQQFLDEYEKAKRSQANAEKLRGLTEESGLREEVKKLTESITSRTKSTIELKTQFDNCRKMEKDLNEKIKNIEQIRAKTKKDIEVRITKWEKALDAAQKKYKSKQTQFDSIKDELDAKEDMLKSYENDIIKEKDNMAQFSNAMNEMEELWKAACSLFEEVEKRFNLEQNVLNKKNREKDKIEEEIKKIDTKIENFDCEVIKKNAKRIELEANVSNLKSKLEKITNEARGLNFDNIEPMPARELDKLRKEIGTQKAEMEKLNENLDVDSLEMSDITNQNLESALEKIKMIERNKRKLMESIDELDKRKVKLVEEAYEKINIEFNKMMETLLPESGAKLVKVNPDILSEGLVIHVRLGTIWKQSLTELSGGQRSLVALALVLSLCLYNPAPFYILDEIDSALDLNHTQNIGCLIKNSFVNTQFICISLKEGMFSNANVLFHVSYANGRSQVKRNVRRRAVTGSEERADGDGISPVNNPRPRAKVAANKRR